MTANQRGTAAGVKSHHHHPQTASAFSGSFTSRAHLERTITPTSETLNSGPNTNVNTTVASDVVQANQEAEKRGRPSTSTGLTLQRTNSQTRYE